MGVKTGDSRARRYKFKNNKMRMRDKIIQILIDDSYGTTILGLSESGKIYSNRDDEWTLHIDSPELPVTSSSEGGE